MATRRTPLASNPNAANSPCRAPMAGSKRARVANQDHDNVSPPKKRQMLRVNPTGARAAPDIVAEEPRCGVFAGKPSALQPSNFQRKLVAARDSKPEYQQAHGDKNQKLSQTDTVAYQNWRNYYWKVFPTYVIYFESLPNDVGPRAARQIHALGARREKFFSKEVTHIVTTRTLPQDSKVRDSRAISSRESASTSQANRAETIDPAILNRITDPHYRSKSTSGAHSHRRNQLTLNDRRQQSSADILQKAREMGIKIWAFEKFERMISELLTADRISGDEPLLRPAGDPAHVPSKRERETDLSQLLREEKNNAPTERKPWQEIVPFRGCFIYVHDMEERVKPVMIRDYARTAKNEDGEWPQFRSVSKGRCPFVEEPPQPLRDDKHRSKEKTLTKSNSTAREMRPVQPAATAKSKEVACDVPRTRSTTKSPQKRALQDNADVINQMPKPSAPASLVKPFEPPILLRQASTGIDNMPPMLGSAQANFRGIPRNPGGEPLASGVQQNVTSAIRSQMFSSTAPSAPGIRVGLNKQQHQMSRRVLERQSGFSANSIPSSINVNDVRAAINHDKAPAQRRSTRQRAAGKLTRIHEDETLSEDEEQGVEPARDGKCAARRKQPIKREAKPGYCENCRDKYSDFHQHIASKKHRKFALCDDNFSELDALLIMLTRR